MYNWGIEDLEEDLQGIVMIYYEEATVFFLAKTNTQDNTNQPAIDQGGTILISNFFYVENFVHLVKTNQH